MVRRVLLLVVSLLFFSFSPGVKAERTDLVFLKNGDRVTGEVKSLLRGKLEFKTDHMGTLHIDWEDIEQIVSSTGQSIELTNGQRFYGPLQKPEESDMVIVNTEHGPVGVDALDVVAMYPVEAGFWQRLDLDASLGFTWDKASNVGRYNLDINAAYRRPKTITTSRYVTEITTQEGRANTVRAKLDGSHILFNKNKRFRMYFGNLEHNDGLGIDLRALAGAGVGWVPIRTQKHWLVIGGGLDVNREIPIDGETQMNLEGVATVNYEYFKYSTPERQFNAKLMVFPSLTDSGRIRASFDTSFKFEFVRDFFWKLSFYANYDNKPISSQAATHDYGYTSSLGYNF